MKSKKRKYLSFQEACIDCLRKGTEYKRGEIGIRKGDFDFIEFFIVEEEIADTNQSVHYQDLTSKWFKIPKKPRCPHCNKEL